MIWSGRGWQVRQPLPIDHKKSKNGLDLSYQGLFYWDLLTCHGYFLTRFDIAEAPLFSTISNNQDYIPVYPTSINQLADSKSISGDEADKIEPTGCSQGKRRSWQASA